MRECLPQVLVCVLFVSCFAKQTELGVSFFFFFFIVVESENFL
jgi:hypothetical protein